MWHLEFTVERGKATRTFVCTVPVCRRRVLLNNGEIRAEKISTESLSSDSVLGQRSGWQYVRELNRSTCM